MSPKEPDRRPEQRRGFWRVDNLIPDTIRPVEAGAFAPGHAEGVEVHAGTSQQCEYLPSDTGLQQSVPSRRRPRPEDRPREVSEALNERSIQELPNLTRNFTAFALLTPGMQHSSFNILGPRTPGRARFELPTAQTTAYRASCWTGPDNRDPVLESSSSNPTWIPSENSR